MFEYIAPTSFIAACGSGRSASFIPSVPATWSVTTIALIAIFSSAPIGESWSITPDTFPLRGTSRDWHSYLYLDVRKGTNSKCGDASMQHAFRHLRQHSNKSSLIRRQTSNPGASALRVHVESSKNRGFS